MRVSGKHLHPCIRRGARHVCAAQSLSVVINIDLEVIVCAADVHGNWSKSGARRRSRRNVVTICSRFLGRLAPVRDRRAQFGSGGYVRSSRIVDRLCRGQGVMILHVAGRFGADAVARLRALVGCCVGPSRGAGRGRRGLRSGRPAGAQRPHPRAAGWRYTPGRQRGSEHGGTARH